MFDSDFSTTSTAQSTLRAFSESLVLFGVIVAFVTILVGVIN